MSTINCKQAREIPIVDFLKREGFSPAYIRGTKHWYLSPLRNEHTASFKVDSEKNAWYDFGLAEGGNLIDLGVKLFQCSVEELLVKLSSGEHAISFHPQTADRLPPFEPDNKVIINGVAELSDKSLLDYLNSRGIGADLARTYCKEINFSIGDRSWLAIGFPNRSGGWELRNTWFKGASSPKDITHIAGNGRSVYVTEGFMDFLSLQKLRLPEPGASFLVLNSASLIGRSIDLLRAYPNRLLYLDRDNSGFTAATKLREAGLEFTDRSAVYRGHNDLNEFLKHRLSLALKPVLKQQQSKGRDRGMSM